MSRLFDRRHGQLDHLPELIQRQTALRDFAIAVHQPAIHHVGHAVKNRAARILRSATLRSQALCLVLGSKLQQDGRPDRSSADSKPAVSEKRQTTVAGSSFDGTTLNSRTIL